MKTKHFFLTMITTILIASGLMAQNIWVNEIHYDNTGTDENEFIEVVLENPGLYNLADFSIILYNGNNGGSYDTRTLDNFTMGSVSGNFTLYWFNYTANGGSIQNGAPDGMAIAYQNNLIPGQFLSYEGTFMAIDGPASGVTSTDIGVSESSSTPVGYSLQLSGSGTTYGNFIWQSEQPNTAGTLNINQTLGGGVLPEPSDYPAAFDAEAVMFSITVSWEDAAGTQPPQAYLVKGSESSTVSLPVDGVPEPDDLDFSDGSGAKNVSQGVQVYTFGNLKSNTTYYFWIFPYTNNGADINYKTDGTPPYAQATTANINVIIYKDFEDNTFDPWDTISLASDKGWSIAIYNNNRYAYINGYQATEPCNDWLISPSMNFDLYINEVLSFKTAMNYTGPPLEVKMSTDYVTGSDPSASTWTDIAATLSPGSWTWTPSGNIDVSGFSGNNVHLAFHYISDTDAAAWELDDILISGDSFVGIPQEHSSLTAFILNPNPAGDFVKVTLNNPGNKEIRILDLSGRTLFSQTTDKGTETIDLSGLTPGIYFVEVKEFRSSAVSTRKLIIR
jgi:hypothetical protein